jgi:hypothetical protein
MAKMAEQRCSMHDSAPEKNQGSKAKLYFKESDWGRTLEIIKVVIETSNSKKNQKGKLEHKEQNQLQLQPRLLDKGETFTLWGKSADLHDCWNLV